MVKREKRLTKRERKEKAGKGPSGAPANSHKHIHCIACGRHLEASEMDGDRPTATMLTCQHGSHFAACLGCREKARVLLDEHDRTGQPPKSAAAWH